MFDKRNMTITLCTVLEWSWRHGSAGMGLTAALVSLSASWWPLGAEQGQSWRLQPLHGLSWPWDHNQDTRGSIHRQHNQQWMDTPTNLSSRTWPTILQIPNNMDWKAWCWNHVTNTRCKHCHPAPLFLRAAETNWKYSRSSKPFTSRNMKNPLWYCTTFCQAWEKRHLGRYYLEAALHYISREYPWLKTHMLGTNSQ